MIEAELYAGGLGEGKCWKKLKEEIRAGRSEVEAIDLAKAAMTFHEAAKVNTGDLSRIESQLEKLTKQVSMLAYLNGAGSTEDQAQAKRQVAQKKAEEEKNAERAKQIKKHQEKKTCLPTQPQWSVHQVLPVLNEILVTSDAFCERPFRSSYIPRFLSDVL